MAPSLLSSKPDTRTNTVQIPVLTAEQYRDTVAKCRLQHKFHFLSLPTALRGLIYIRLWENSTVKVTSWLKDHEGEFALDERCQLLLTCHAIYNESRAYYYRLVTWKVVSMSRLQHFTWPTKYAHCLSVAKLTLTDLDSLPEFSRQAHRFPKLRIVTVDTASEFIVKASRRVHNNKERQIFVNSLLGRRFYKEFLAPCFYTLRAYIVHLTITIHYDNELTEVALVDVDNQRIIYNYVPLTAPERLYQPTMPCSEDPDVEYLITKSGTRFGRSTDSRDAYHSN